MIEEGRYAPLANYLAALRGDDHTLSFAEIEQILGRKLPPSAAGRHGRQWWANTQTHSQGHAWIRAGWKVDSVDTEKTRVRFRRAARTPRTEAADRGPNPSDQIVLRLASLSPGARRLIEDYVETSGTDAAKAVGEIVEAAAMERRRKVVEWFAEKGLPTGSSSADLVREDRDGR